MRPGLFHLVLLACATVNMPDILLYYVKLLLLKRWDDPEKIMPNRVETRNWVSPRELVNSIMLKRTAHGSRLRGATEKLWGI